MCFGDGVWVGKQSQMNRRTRHQWMTQKTAMKRKPPQPRQQKGAGFAWLLYPFIVRHNKKTGKLLELMNSFCARFVLFNIFERTNAAESDPDFFKV